MMFKEDNFLTSANLCRWVIDFKDLQLGKQVGMGSYGVVFKGRWKGVDVAVKKFVKQKLDERRMLEFRAEMAFLSELHHPNIVLFIGTQVTPPMGVRAIPSSC
jgi:serine/threonine protein kinase